MLCSHSEFGMNVKGHASGVPTSARAADDWRNSTRYAQNWLSDSILQSNWNPQSGVTAANQGAW